ncbi:MAG: hypothetical protein ACRDJM_00825 [Actinomycetota bacterium]
MRSKGIFAVVMCAALAPPASGAASRQPGPAARVTDALVAFGRARGPASLRVAANATTAAMASTAATEAKRARGFIGAAETAYGTTGNS